MKNNKLWGIDKNYKADTLWGVLTFVVIFLVNFIAPGIAVIGIPSVSQSIASETGRFIVVGILAPIFETFFFFSIVLGIFYNKLKLPFLVSAILSSITFVLFHISAYGITGTSGAFLTAGIMGMVFAYQTKLTKSVIPATVTHSLLNIWISGYFPFSVIALFLSLIGGII